jgi:serine/threonine-protein kinase
MTKAGRVLGGKYRLDQLLGRGGMGSVWAAKHLLLDCAVAVKVLEHRRPDGADVRARFEREARAVAQLRTPHVAQIHDQGVDDETAYMVMELLDGEDLGARLRREGRLPIREVASIVSQAARVLRLAHEAGIVHRDLKPANVFLARAHDEEIVKILDFGIAKSLFDRSSPELTTTGALLGTLNYMSPEQLRDPRSADWRSDLWSLAVLAFQALTGREPFAGRAFGDTVNRICKDPLPLASDMAVDLPHTLDAFFERAFARQRSERFQSAHEMADRLAEIAAEEGDDCVATQLFDARSLVPPSTPRSYPDAPAAWIDNPTTSSARMLLQAVPASTRAPDSGLTATAAPWRLRVDTQPPQSCAPMSLPLPADRTTGPSSRPPAQLPLAAYNNTSSRHARPRRGALWAATIASVITVLVLGGLARVGALGRLPLATGSARGAEPVASESGTYPTQGAASGVNAPSEAAANAPAEPPPPAPTGEPPLAEPSPVSSAKVAPATSSGVATPHSSASSAPPRKTASSPPSSRPVATADAAEVFSRR